MHTADQLVLCAVGADVGTTVHKLNKTPGYQRQECLQDSIRRVRRMQASALNELWVTILWFQYDRAETGQQNRHPIHAGVYCHHNGA